MNHALRTSAAHVFVQHLSAPQLTADDHRHLGKVLRLRNGETVTCSDGAGSWRVCAWNAGALDVVGDIQAELAPTPLLTVAVSPVKGDRTDFVVEKLVEVGVDHIVLLAPVERSVVRWAANKVDHVMERYSRIARAAAMQSRRVFLPTVSGPTPLASLAHAGAAVAEPGGTADWGDVTTMIIGPEGGFTASEIAGIPSAVHLGPTILRAETAAIVGAARMVAHWRR